MLVLVDDRSTVLRCPQATYVPGLGTGGADFTLSEAVRIRADRRRGGLGRLLMTQAIRRARFRGCAQMRLTAMRNGLARAPLLRRSGLQPSHEGFKDALEKRSHAILRSRGIAARRSRRRGLRSRRTADGGTDRRPAHPASRPSSGKHSSTSPEMRKGPEPKFGAFPKCIAA
ncbi:GNAT family N-acetyltransferase, partial [Actinocorallia aurea]